MDTNKFVGSKIKEFREARGWTQDQLAEKLNTTRQTISRYESGTRKTNQDVLFDLSVLFNVKIDSFFPERESKSAASQKNIGLLAAHIDDNVSDEQMAQIINYIDLVKKANSRD